MASATGHNDNDPIADFVGNVIRDQFLPGLKEPSTNIATVCMPKGDIYEVYIIVNGNVETTFEANHCQAQ